MSDQDDSAIDDSHQTALHEAGRLLFSKPWDFVLGVAHLDQLTDADGMEIAFAGRSNVGKSSLINALVGQKALARTSNTPGRTQQLNVFTTDAPLTIVDMPGYGYAKAPLPTVEAWNRLIKRYLQGRPNLARVFVLVDSRHGLKDNDKEIFDLLDKSAVSYQIILTKTDKLKPGQIEKVRDNVLNGLLKRPAAHPEVLITSSVEQSGLSQVRAAVAELLEQQGFIRFE
jgi:GTP-binding protein